MRTVTYGSVLTAVSSRALLDAASADATRTQAIMTFIADRVRTAWDFYRWPETTAISSFNYRTAWASGSSYAVDDEIYFTSTVSPEYDGYYVCLATATAGQSPITHPAKWELMTNFARYVPLSATVDTVFFCWDEDPRAYDDAANVPFSLTNSGVQFNQDAPNTVWMQYRLAAPNFDATIYDAGTSYTSGSRVLWLPTAGSLTAEVYLTTATNAGDTPLTQPSKFTLITFPYILARAVKAGALADWFASDGQADRAAALEGSEGDGTLTTYFGSLEEQARQLSILQGQRGVYRFVPPPTVGSQISTDTLAEALAG